MNPSLAEASFNLIGMVFKQGPAYFACVGVWAPTDRDTGMEALEQVRGCIKDAVMVELEMPA